MNTRNKYAIGLILVVLVFFGCNSVKLGSNINKLDNKGSKTGVWVERVEKVNYTLIETVKYKKGLKNGASKTFVLYFTADSTRNCIEPELFHMCGNVKVHYERSGRYRKGKRIGKWRFYSFCNPPNYDWIIYKKDTIIRSEKRYKDDCIW